MADYFFKIFTSLRNCNVACSPALRLGGASEQLSGLCLQKVHSPLFKLDWVPQLALPVEARGAVAVILKRAQIAACSSEHE